MTGFRNKLEKAIRRWSSNSGGSPTVSSEDLSEYCQTNSTTLDQIVQKVVRTPGLSILEENLKIHKEIGMGFYGRVSKGSLCRPRGAPCHGPLLMEVAVKTAGSLDENALRNLEIELKVMSAINPHPNIVALIGAVNEFDSRGLSIVLELCEDGSLLDYLRKNRDNFEDTCPQEFPSTSMKRTLTPIDLCSYAIQVARAMWWLGDVPCFHRDLAARNVLLTRNGTLAKISDFGLSRHTGKDYYRLTDDSILADGIPFQWMSPETIEKGYFTTASDVWSYGILLFEIFSLGENVYPNLHSNIGFIGLYSEIRKGLRNPKPKFANDQIFDLMTECTLFEADQRIRFKEIFNRLKDLIKGESLGYYEGMKEMLETQLETLSDYAHWREPYVSSKKSPKTSRISTSSSSSTSGHRVFFELPNYKKRKDVQTPKSNSN